MVQLKNISYSDNIITCDLIPEDSVKAGKLTVDLVKGEHFAELPEGYEYCEMHIDHAVCFLLSVAPSELPKERLIMWY